jgi:hypothetical protein
LTIATAAARAPGGCAVLAGLALAFAAVPAEARVGDREWARCVWERAPVSAQNWIGMETPRWQDNMASRSELLGFRVVAMCTDEAADETRPNRMPNWSGLKSALRSVRPRELGTVDAETPTVELCQHWARDGDRDTLFRVDVVHRNGDRRVTVFQQYFSDHEGQSVRLPRDLRMMPPAGAQTSTECRQITNSGELQGA